MRLLSTEPLRSDARNHTIPLLEILEEGEWAFIVTPEWGFLHWEPCASVEEYVEFSIQMFEVKCIHFLVTGLLIQWDIERD